MTNKFKRYKWVPIKKRSYGRIPWGYEQDANDPQLLQPIAEFLDVLEAGKDYLAKGCSSREVANWVSDVTGLRISHSGLIERIKYDNQRFKELYGDETS